MKQKKHIYCGHCESIAVWFKKGKHRRLICNNCGVIAHNPIPLLAMAGSYLVKKGVEKLTSPKIESPPQIRNVTPRRNLYKDYIDLEIAKELAHER